MSGFYSKLVIEPSDDERTATLFRSLEYESDLLDQWVTVPSGFVTDFTSVPKLFWNILPPLGSYGEPAVVHDYLYRTQRTDRKTADAVMLEAMTVHGVPWLTRQIIYRAVRLFGWAAWQQNKSRLIPV